MTGVLSPIEPSALPPGERLKGEPPASFIGEIYPNPGQAFAQLVALLAGGAVLYVIFGGLR